MASTRDQDQGKGAVEQDDRTDKIKTNTSLGGQLGHRTEDAMVKSSDSDFPEPGGNPEHSGEPETPRKPGSSTP